MKEKNPFNIFSDNAHHSPRPEKKTAIQKKQEIPLTSPKVEDTKQLEIAPEMEEMWNRAAKQHHELVSKLDQIQKITGMSLNDMHEYMNNPKNFKSFEWEILQKQRAISQQNIDNLIGEEGKAMIKKKEEYKTSKVRKGKTLGTRKHWIPIK